MPPPHLKRKKKVHRKPTPSGFIISAVKSEILRRRKITPALLAAFQEESKEILESKQQEVILKKKKLMKKIAEESGDPKYQQEREREKMQEMVAKSAVDRAVRMREVNARLLELQAKLEVLNAKKQDLFHSLKDVLQSEQKEKEKKKDLTHMKALPLSGPTRVPTTATSSSIISSLTSAPHSSLSANTYVTSPKQSKLPHLFPSSKGGSSSLASQSSSQSSSQISSSSSSSSISFSSFANTSHSSPSVSTVTQQQGMSTYAREHHQPFGGTPQRLGSESSYSKDPKIGYPSFRNMPSNRHNFPSHTFPTHRHERYETFRPDPRTDSKFESTQSSSSSDLIHTSEDIPPTDSPSFSRHQQQQPPFQQQERIFAEGDPRMGEYIPRPTIVRNRRPPFHPKNRMGKRGWRRGGPSSGEMTFLIQPQSVVSSHLIPLVPHPSHVLPPHLSAGFPPPNVFPHFVPISSSDPSLLYSLPLSDPGRSQGYVSMSSEHRPRQGGPYPQQPLQQHQQTQTQTQQQQQDRMESMRDSSKS